MAFVGLNKSLENLANILGPLLSQANI